MLQPLPLHAAHAAEATAAAAVTPEAPRNAAAAVGAAAVGAGAAARRRVRQLLPPWCTSAATLWILLMLLLALLQLQQQRLSDAMPPSARMYCVYVEQRSSAFAKADCAQYRGYTRYDQWRVIIRECIYNCRATVIGTSVRIQDAQTKVEQFCPGCFE